MGDEVGHLEQAVGVGTVEGGAADDPLYGHIPSLLAVLPDLAPAGDGVAAPETAVEAGHHFLAALFEAEEGVAVRGCGWGVDAVEQPVEADPCSCHLQSGVYRQPLSSLTPPFVGVQQRVHRAVGFHGQSAGACNPRSWYEWRAKGPSAASGLRYPYQYLLLV